MATNTTPKESTCRKNIAAVLSLLDFHDDESKTSTQVMLSKLVDINKSKEFAAATRSANLEGETSGVEKHPHSHDHMKTPGSSTSASSESSVLELIVSDDDEDEMAFDDFIRTIGGSELKLVMVKKLTNSDVDPCQGRLLMLASKVLVYNLSFLREYEVTKLGRKDAISVSVFDLQRRKSTLNLAQWNKYYVLKTEWNELVRTNKLKKDMMIGVWSFRVDQDRLCFALVLA